MCWVSQKRGKPAACSASHAHCYLVKSLVHMSVTYHNHYAGTYDYDMYFSKLMEVGANYARLWLTDSGWDDLAVEIAVGNFSLPNTW